MRASGGPLRSARSNRLPPGSCRVAPVAGASLSRAPLRPRAMQQPQWAPQPQQPQQPMRPLQPQQAPQQRPAQQAPLARAPYQPAPQQPVFLELSQVLNKPVITRTSGRCLGTICGAWLDPGAGALVSFDLDDRKAPGGGAGGGLGGALAAPARAGNIPLTALRQVGGGRQGGDARARAHAARVPRAPVVAARLAAHASSL